MEPALKTMIENLPVKTGKTLQQWKTLLAYKAFSTAEKPDGGSASEACVTPKPELPIFYLRNSPESNNFHSNVSTPLSTLKQRS